MNLSDDFILELTHCQQRLYGYIFRRMANRDQAMEVLQQTNLVLCRKADDFEPAPILTPGPPPSPTTRFWRTENWPGNGWCLPMTCFM